MSVSLLLEQQTLRRTTARRAGQGFRQCARCVMDTTDPDIQFDEQGVCSNCREFMAARARLLGTETQRSEQLARLIAKIKSDGSGQPYDCLVGVSGGVDSTYVAYLAKQLGLRPLAVHVDNGWNSELAVGNIEKALKHLDIDLDTFVIDWEEFRDLQIAFLKSSTVDAEMPTDHAIRAALRRVAGRNKIRYILHGRNLSTEGLLPWGWSYCALDWKYIRSVNARHGTRRLKAYPHLSLPDLLFSVAVQRIQNVAILNYAPFSKAAARDVLVKQLGWIDYGGKHYESIYTRFFQGYILPRKFNIDKRKAHLSSLVCTGQVSRDEALRELDNPPLPPEVAARDKEYVLKKLGLSEQEFDQLMAAPQRTYRDFPNHADYLLLHSNRRLQRVLKVMKSLRIVPAGFAKV